MGDDTPRQAVGRRRFLTSLFGLSAMAEKPAEAARPKAADSSVSFFWANLENGQIAFPTGMTVPSGEPGSLMKLVTAAALLESGLFTHDQTLECRGTLRLNHKEYHCLHPHGRVDLLHALGFSCNVFFAQAASKLTAEAICHYAELFGLNLPVAGYSGKSFPQVAEGDPVPFAIGLASDLSPNALQLLRLAALVATKGAVPPLYDASQDASSQQPLSLALQPGTWHLLEQGMRLCAREGTAASLDPTDELKLAAKTGTSPHGIHFQSWIIGYFPYDKPKYAFCLRAASGTSQDSAVPHARTFLLGTKWP